jgi:RND family efflux transporter MFP subunit
MRPGTGARLLSGFGGALLVACGGHPTHEEPPRPVRLQQAEASPVGGGVRYSANIVAKEEVPLAFKQSGYLREILQVRGVDGKPRNVHEGDRVAKDTVLARLREVEYEETARQARSQVVQAEATLRRASQDFERADALYAKQSLTQPDYDRAKEQLDVAQARLEGAQAQYQVAKTSLDDCALKAPFSGVVTSAGLEVGQLVSPQTEGFVLSDLTSMKAEFGVSDVMLADLKMGSTLSVGTQSVPGVEFHGRISRISPAADPKSRVFEVELTIPNPEGRLKPGMIAALRVGDDARGRADAQDTPCVRLSAIVRPPGEAEGYAVFVVEEVDGRPVARVRKVSLGEALGNSIAVTSGLKVGERVIVTGATLLTDGDPVRIVP